MSTGIDRLATIAADLGAVLLIARDAKWFSAIAEAVEPAETFISGPARVIDGETVVVAGKWVRLIGIDVAEVQTGWGRMAQEKMEMIVRYELTCRLTGEKFNRMEVCYCTTPDGTDLAQAIVATGWALACPIHDDRYVKFEKSEAERAAAAVNNIYIAPAFLLQPRSSYCAKRP